MSTRNVTAVIMCTYNRIHRLQRTIDLLKKQTVNNFDFHICNNNPDHKSVVDGLCENNPDTVTTVKHSINVGGIARFIRAKEIAGQVEKVIFIDDDQDFKSTLIEDMTDCYENNTINSWWGWTVGNNYMHRQRVYDTTRQADYCGTGGMIIDSNIFKTLDLSSVPEEYAFIEDLWLSFVARYEYNYKLYGRDFPIVNIDDRQDQWRRITLNRKNQFLHYLRNKYET